jgi:hypothetical protein
LLHAQVRQRILKLTSTNPEYYDVANFGPPCNTLDSIHSIATFCCNHMWLQLPCLGITPRPDEIADYIAVFRYLAYVLGTPSDYFSTPDKAKAVMESLYYYETKPSLKSEIVLTNFINCLVDLPPFNISQSFLEAGGRWFNGHELCDELKVGRPGFFFYMLFQGQAWLFQAMVTTQRFFPAFDRFIIKVRNL